MQAASFYKSVLNTHVVFFFVAVCFLVPLERLEFESVLTNTKGTLRNSRLRLI